MLPAGGLSPEWSEMGHVLEAASSPVICTGTPTCGALRALPACPSKAEVVEASYFWPVQYPNFPIADASGATQLAGEGQMGSLCPAPGLAPFASATRYGPSVCPGLTTPVRISFAAIISHVTPCSPLQTGSPEG